MRSWSVVLVGLVLAACTIPPPDRPVATPRPVYSTYGIDASPYAYGNPSAYGYANPWSQPNAATSGYMGDNRFSPRPGLLCERSRNICYDRNGFSDAETTKYLGSRDAWNSKRLYGGPEIYPPTIQ